jgi:hypothetical protein
MEITTFFQNRFFSWRCYDEMLKVMILKMQKPGGTKEDRGGTLLRYFFLDII